jgi:tRNA threonylcarbamoyladenosine modification (KEOPS) complex  Pcc1 subunit
VPRSEVVYHAIRNPLMQRADQANPMVRVRVAAPGARVVIHISANDGTASGTLEGYISPALALMLRDALTDLMDGGHTVPPHELRKVERIE